MARKILHLDLDAFFCAVEELRDPSLRGKPFAVGGRPESRGVVASCSYAARQYGVHSAQAMGIALKLCPDLIIVESRHGTYHEASQQVMARLWALTPLVEQISIDEAFLDITNLNDESLAVATTLQRRINSELGLPCSIGGASNKLVAKVATEVAKGSRKGDGPPNAILIVPAGDEAAFLADKPVRLLWGVGPKMEGFLAEMQIRTIGDIARRSEDELIEAFGKNGYWLSRHARGMDDSPVTTEHEAKSVSRETTFSSDVRDRRVLEATLRELASSVAGRLKRERLAGTTIKIKLRWSDFTTLTRQETLDKPTDDGEIILASALRLLAKHWPVGKPVRLIGVGVSGLGLPIRQLGLWDRDWQKEGRLVHALQSLRDRYGEDVVLRGSERGPASRTSAKRRMNADRDE